MKKFALKATVAAAAALASSLSMAVVKLDAEKPVTTSVYASEIVLANPQKLDAAATGTLADQKAEVALGASFAAGKQAYVRFDLDGGTFATALSATSFAIEDSGTSPSAAAVAISQGGAANDDYVIFAVNPNADTKYLVAEKVGALTTNGINVTDKNGVKISYRLYETLTAAVNQTPKTALKEKTDIEFIKFAPAVVTTITASPTETADVAAKDGTISKPFTKFDSTALTTAKLGNVKIELASPTAPALANGTAATLAAILHATDNLVTVTGDFSWVLTSPTVDKTKIKLDTTPAITADTLTADKATFKVPEAGLTGVDIVATTNGNAIPAGNYSTAVDLIGETGYEPADTASTASGKIVRNGTTLKFPALSVGKGTNTWVQLVNTSSLNAPLTATCYLNDGSNVAGAAGLEVAANSTLRQKLADVCPTNTSKVESAVLTLAVPEGSVNGTVMRKSPDGVMSYANASAGNE
ncbi:MAG: hypothetical protein KIG98_03660 [Comamonas sp.]|nr:hypothetical protein [Comamonas sp.]